MYIDLSWNGEVCTAKLVGALNGMDLGALDCFGKAHCVTGALEDLRQEIECMCADAGDHDDPEGVLPILHEEL